MKDQSIDTNLYSAMRKMWLDVCHVQLRHLSRVIRDHESLKWGILDGVQPPQDLEYLMNNLRLGL